MKDEEQVSEPWCPPGCKGPCWYYGSSTTMRICSRYDERAAYFAIPKRIHDEDRALAAIAEKEP